MGGAARPLPRFFESQNPFLFIVVIFPRSVATFCVVFLPVLSSPAWPSEEPRTNLDTPNVSVAAKPGAFDSPTPVKLGIPYITFPNSESSLLSDTVEWFKAQFGNQLVILPHSETSLRNAVLGGEIDLFIASSGFYREFASAGSKDLATLVDDKKKNPNESTAATVIVRRGRDDLFRLDDLRGRSIAAGADDFYAGWRMVEDELKRRGLGSASFFSDVHFTGMPLSEVVDRVIRGESEAGVLSACYFENLLETNYPGINEVRVLQPRSDSLRCLHTTAPYPGLTIATMPSSNPATMRAITRELFSMPPSGTERAVWSVATDFNRVDELLKGLALGPYRHLREWTVSRFYHEYRFSIALLAIVIAGVFIHSLRTEAVVRKRTAQLREAMDEQRRMQLAATEQSARIERLEREGVMQQLSSMLAHELRQPMTAIGFFTKGLISRLRRGEFDRDAYLGVLEKIRTLNQQSNAVIEHVRGYAKAKIDRSELDLSSVVKQTVESLRKARFSDRKIRFCCDVPESIVLVADRLEIELIVTNLVKNAADACAGVANPEVRVSLEALTTGVQGAKIVVRDNGPALTDEEVARLGRLFETTKSDGLGLGISIVRRIAESYGGKLCYRPRKPQGLAAEVFLWNPLQTASRETAS